MAALNITGSTNDILTKPRRRFTKIREIECVPSKPIEKGK